MTRRSLAQPSARFAGDKGAPDLLARDAMGRVTDATSYVRAIVALCGSRLLLPVVATGEEGKGVPDPNRRAELAAVTIRDGAAAHLIAFTGLDSLHAWSPQARPVPCLLDELAATAAPAGANKLLIDPAGPNPLVIEGETLARLADGYALVEFEDGRFGWVRAEASEPGLPNG